VLTGAVRRDLVLLISSRILGGLAMQMTSVALGWLVYARTGSAYALGLLGLFQFLPMIPLVAVTGHAADQFDRRKVAAASMAGQVACAVAFFGFGGSALPMSWLYALALGLGAARAFMMPAQRSLLAALSPPEDLARVVALSSSTSQLALMAGPALGGLAYALVGPATFLAAAALLAAAVALSLLIRRPAARVAAEREGVWTRAFAGLVFVRSSPVLLGAITLDLFAVILGGVTSLLPIFARDILHAGPEGLGVLQSGPALGAVLVGFSLARIRIRRRAGVVLLVSVAGYGVATILFGLSRSFPLSLVCMVALGGFDMVSVVIRQTLEQVNTPDAMRGRVGAVSSVFVAGSNRLGDFESGMVAGLVGAPAAAIIGGLGSVLVVLGMAAVAPSLRRADRLEGPGMT
jgi:MFS family permease